MIYRGPGFLSGVWVGPSPGSPPPPPSCQQLVSLSQSFCASSAAGTWGERVGKEPNPTTERKSGPLQIVPYSLLFTTQFWYLLFCIPPTSVKKSKRSHKIVENKVIFTFLLFDGFGSVQTMTGSGGPKTCRSYRFVSTTSNPLPCGTLRLRKKVDIVRDSGDCGATDKKHSFISFRSLRSFRWLCFFTVV
jgi:hypothetical protein